MTLMSPPAAQPLRLHLYFGERTPSNLAPYGLGAPAMTSERQLRSSRYSGRDYDHNEWPHREKPSHALGWRTETRLHACQTARGASQHTSGSDHDRGRSPKLQTDDSGPISRRYQHARHANSVAVNPRAKSRSSSSASTLERSDLDILKEVPRHSAGPRLPIRRPERSDPRPRSMTRLPPKAETLEARQAASRDLAPSHLSHRDDRATSALVVSRRAVTPSVLASGPRDPPEPKPGSALRDSGEPFRLHPSLRQSKSAPI